MKVILLTNIKGFGQIGDIKNVSDGYARNFLIPRKMAKAADENAMKEVEGLKKKREATETLQKERAVQLRDQVPNITLEYTKKASKTGKLFSSVTKKEISDDLSKNLGAVIPVESIDLKEHGEHIKQVGEHIVGVELAPGVNAEFKIIIKSE